VIPFELNFLNFSLGTRKKLGEGDDKVLLWGQVGITWHCLEDQGVMNKE
jgi:hypothetical protein